MTEAKALVLEILRQDHQLAMGVFEKEELVSTVRHYSQLPFLVKENNRLSQEIISILNKVDKKGTLEPDLINNLKKTGQRLWDNLLTHQVKDRLKTTHIKDLLLFIDEELINIPWELLYDGEDFLSLKFNLGRLLRTKRQFIHPPVYRSLKDKLKMLILANPTNDLESAYREGVYIRNQFDKLRKFLSIDFKSTSIDTVYTKKNLRDYDLVHFAGHCEYDPENPLDSGWVLEDGRFTVEDISTLGESLSLPSLVFANACESIRGYSADHSSDLVGDHRTDDTPDLVDLDYQRKTYSLASAFLFSGTRHYLGTIRKIEDPISFHFAQEFYTQLISGKSVGECVRLGRLRLIKEYGMSRICWVSYLLYGDPNFVLFRARVKPSAPKFKRALSLYKKRIAGLSLAIAGVSLCIYLYLWLPTLNPSTYVLFLQSRRLFGQGNNHAAVSIANRIIQKDPKFLAAYPILADAYHNLGQRDLALKYCFAYALQSEKQKENKHLTSAYLGIGWIYHLQGEYAQAFDFYEKALTLSQKHKDILNEATALRRQAECYTDKKDYDKALELLTKSSEMNRVRQRIYGHRYNLACDYFDIGLVFINKDDYPTARKFYEKSRILFAQLKLNNELSDCYFNIGETYLYEKQYQKALEYYQKGLKLDQLHDHQLNLASDYIMLGELYLEMNNLLEAEAAFNQAISISRQIDARIELADAYYNLGLLYQQKKQRDKARKYLSAAQEIYRAVNPSRYEKLKQELGTGP